MAWNHKARVYAMAVAFQVAAGGFVQPSAATDLVACSSPTNTHEAITADDPTGTGTAWESNRIFLGKNATVGCTVPLRGPGGAAPPAADTFVPGRFLQADGWAEIRKAAASNAVLVAGSTTTALNLANTESAVDSFLVGAPIQSPSIGTGFQQTSLIRGYAGAGKVATLAETLGGAPAAGVAYTIPAYLSYVAGTLTAAPRYLSISLWRDKKRYDYRDWQPASLAVNVPVGNDQNTAFPDLTTSGKALVQAIVDDASPVLPTALLSIQPPPAKNGKFYLDRVKLGHQNISLTVTTTVGAASNQNQATGQDAYDIQSGTRAIALDLNQMAVSDFDLNSREDAQTTLPVMSTWGLGSGNNWGLLISNIQLDPFSPGERNGYVSLTGNAVTTDVDKWAALTIWW